MLDILADFFFLWHEIITFTKWSVLFLEKYRSSGSPRFYSRPIAIFSLY